MSCDVGEVTESLENELCYEYNYELCSFSKLSVASPTLQLILQPFPRFIYVTAHSPTLPLLHLRHSSFSKPSFAFSYVKGFSLTVTWRAAHIVGGSFWSTYRLFFDNFDSFILDLRLFCDSSESEDPFV